VSYGLFGSPQPKICVGATCHVVRGSWELGLVGAAIRAPWSKHHALSPLFVSYNGLPYGKILFDKCAFKKWNERL